ncbi:MAG: hypothetical protein F4215_13465 [Gemmatimonadetes bacterium]|nr:hypothetical protein [Gemmatimonadota bacterium]
MEQELTEKRKKIETLKRAHVRFSGTLFIRIFSNQPSAFSFQSPAQPPKGKNHWITGVVLARGGLLHAAMTPLQRTIS